MAAPRLPFLWPMLYRATERAVLETRPMVRRRALHVTSRRRQNAVQQRYGTANQPPPHIGQEAKAPIKSEPERATTEAKAQEGVQQAEKNADNKPLQEISPNTDAALESSKTAISDKAAATKMHDDPMMDINAAAAETAAEKPVESLLDSVPNPAQASTAGKESAMPAPNEEPSNMTHDEHQPPIHAPHIEPPRYVHNFDTFGLVKRLEESGWKDDQAIHVMKAMRLMLADNMDLARDALVSKSQVENETYLFKAACSELRTEVITRRKGEQENMRAQRTQLQHEVEILNQRLGQDSVTLKDELKGLFDDRKMSVRNEQREMERKIQELNYKITISLQADSRSDVEGLRWIMTRRVIITLGLIVIMVLGSLKLYSNTMHERELEKKRRAAMRNASTQVDSGVDAGSGAAMTATGEMLVKEGDNPAFVSLG